MLNDVVSISEPRPVMMVLTPAGRPAPQQSLSQSKPDWTR